MEYRNNQQNNTNKKVNNKSSNNKSIGYVVMPQMQALREGIKTYMISMVSKHIFKATENSRTSSCHQRIKTKCN